MARDSRRNPYTGDTLVRSDGTLALYVLEVTPNDGCVTYRVFDRLERLLYERKIKLSEWRKLKWEAKAYWEVSTDEDISTNRDPRNDPREGDVMVHSDGSGLCVWSTELSNDGPVTTHTVGLRGSPVGLRGSPNKEVTWDLSDWRKFDWTDYTPTRRCSRKG